jgi:6-phosphogluconolactonase
MDLQKQLENRPFSEHSRPDALRVFKNHEQMSLAASRQMMDYISETLQKRDRCVIGLAGGKTPVACYRLLAFNLRNTCSRESLRHIHCFLGDERVVPVFDPDSNTKMIMDNFILLLPENTVTFHAPNTGLANCDRVAADYERRMVRVVPAFHKIPRFDLIILGLGMDGHTASIFSDTLNQHTRNRHVLPVPKNDIRIHERITLNLNVINAAEQVIFLVSGNDKKPVLQQVLSKNPVYAASHIDTSRRDVLFFVSG